MTETRIGLLSHGLLTSAGRDAASTCAAIRAKLSNPSETRFTDSAGEWIMGHKVVPEHNYRDEDRLIKMAVAAIRECLDSVPQRSWPDTLFLCLSERGRPGRSATLEQRVFEGIQLELGIAFSSRSLVFPNGRVGTASALAKARTEFRDAACTQILIVGVDSLVTEAALKAYEQQDRLLTSTHSNGFMPGEGAAALLVTAECGSSDVLCSGLGFGFEPAHVTSDQPLRADGLRRAMVSALADAGCEMHELDFRVADLSGEQYYFKEAALALGRVLRKRREQFDIVQPAGSMGETGAVAGLACIAVAATAIRSGYAPGPGALVHLSGDSGDRAAIVVTKQESPR